MKTGAELLIGRVFHVTQFAGKGGYFFVYGDNGTRYFAHQNDVRSKELPPENAIVRFHPVAQTAMPNKCDRAINVEIVSGG